MNLILLGVVLVYTVTCEPAFNKTHHLLTKNGYVDPVPQRSARLADSSPTTYSNFPWLAIIYDHNADTDVAQGAFKNAYYVVTSASALAPYESSPEELTLFYGMDDRADTSTGHSRMINQVIIHEGADGSKNDIALVRICPKYKGDKAPIPTAGLAYTAGAPTTLVSYDTMISTAGKNIGEKCECADAYTLYDPKLDICLQAHPSVFSDADDVPGVAVIQNSKLVGLITVPQSSGNGEVAIDLSEYNTWISTNAVYP